MELEVLHQIAKFIYDHDDSSPLLAILDAEILMANDGHAEKIIKIFQQEGMRIQLGAQYSVKGQIAQLINGCKKLTDREIKDNGFT